MNDVYAEARRRIAALEGPDPDPMAREAYYSELAGSELWHLWLPQPGDRVEAVPDWRQA